MRPPFRHMSSADVPVWDAWWKQMHSPIATPEYDVTVGSNGLSAGDVPCEYAAMWKTLRQKRIDVVLHWEASTWIVEVKPTANMSALGQVLAYAYLWAEKHPDKEKPRPVVVCRYADPDLAGVYHQLGVTVWALEGADPELLPLSPVAPPPPPAAQTPQLAPPST